jgi:hypothetical protein
MEELFNLRRLFKKVVEKEIKRRIVNTNISE